VPGCQVLGPMIILPQQGQILRTPSRRKNVDSETMLSIKKVNPEFFFYQIPCIINFHLFLGFDSCFVKLLFLNLTSL
jgi:hypothetical protein